MEILFHSDSIVAMILAKKLQEIIGVVLYIHCLPIADLDHSRIGFVNKSCCFFSITRLTQKSKSLVLRFSWPFEFGSANTGGAISAILGFLRNSFSFPLDNSKIDVSSVHIFRLKCPIIRAKFGKMGLNLFHEPKNDPGLLEFGYG